MSLTKANAGFFNSVCAYFRDFLDTDFRKQRMPKRAISLRDSNGSLTAISIAKYPGLVAAYCQSSSGDGCAI